ncbi:hypothetical protein ACHAXR_006295 [Thalassiosira sp. AJA248-18]
MRYPCHYECSCIFGSDEERSRHEKACPSRIVGCCQSSQSCRRKISEWIIVAEHSPTLMSTCRHQSNALFGAIKEDNIDLVNFFLQEMRDSLVYVLTHESKFGDTIMTFACALGRSDIVQAFCQTIVRNKSAELAVSDLMDQETSRGKTPIIEAVKNNNAGVVSILLSHQANAKLPSKIHKKSALDWAIALRHESIVGLINDHTQLEEHAISLFKAVSKFDVSRVKSLTEGGVPFQRHQDAQFQHEVKSKRHLVELAKQNMNELVLNLKQVDRSKDQTQSDIETLDEHIKVLVKKREDIVSSRRREVMQVTTKVRLAITTNNVTHLCNMANPPLEFELLGKAMCTLLHIRLKKHHTIDENEESRDMEEHGMLYWDEIKLMLQGNSRFFHRIRHYHFEVEIVELAARSQIDGLPGTCSDHLSSMLSNAHQGSDDLGSTIMTSVVHWLWTIFQSLPGHKLENHLVMQESGELDQLERKRIDYDVLASRSAILKRELDYVSESMKNNINQISQLERKLEVSKVMKFVSGGHSVLSWAAGTGNQEILKVLLKRGAHTPLGDDCLAWCATIIQIAFRHSLAHSKISIQDGLAVSLRLKSLSNMIRERLKSLRLPLAESLCNGHPKIALFLDKSDIPLFQSINLFPMFSQPRGILPRSYIFANIEALQNERVYPNGSELISSVIVAGQQYSHEQDPRHCALVESLNFAVKLTDDFLKQRKNKMEAKISKRRETLYTKHRNAMASEMRSAIYRGDFVAIVQASDEGGISLDFEDPTSGMTPLIRAAQEDIYSPMHEWLTNSMGEPVTAVAYLLDRISPHGPNVDYENRAGHTALAMACMHGRLDVISDLLARNADVSRQSIVLNCTAYDLAVREKQLGVVEFLHRLRGS